jgi:tetratricopeptide (TPR) repeat protein
VKCLEQRAELLIQKEKFDEALGDITRVLEIDPARREAHFMRGLVLFHRKEYEAAIKSLDLAI